MYVRFCTHLFVTVSMTTCLAPAAMATNGMNLEGNGAKSAALGGTAFAYDIGNSAMMNNPATLGLRNPGWNISLGLAALMPEVKATLPSPTGRYEAIASDGDFYLMPSLAIVRKLEKFTFGIGFFAQGGMGSEWGTALSGGGPEIRSEVGFSRIMVPVAYDVTDSLTVALQVDYSMAGLDLKMINPRTGDYYDFSNDNDFTGAATGSGWGYKAGIHYKINNALCFGAAYHTKTDINELEALGSLNTEDNKAQYRIINPEWPESYGAGAAWNISERLMLSTDIKRLIWSNTLDAFRLEVNGVPVFGPGGARQDWHDQTIFMVGLQYMMTSSLALRTGFNYAENPIPDDTLNPLAPAIVTTHYTIGTGWQVAAGHNLNAAMTYAPKETAGYANMFGPGIAGSISHRQVVLRLDYDYSF